MNSFLIKNIFKLMYVLILIIESLSILQKLILKEEINLTSLLIKVGVVVCIIWVIKTRQRFAYGFGIIYSGIILLSSVILLFLYIKDFGLLTMLSEHMLLIKNIFILIKIIISSLLLVMFIFAFKRSKIFYLTINELIKKYIELIEKNEEVFFLGGKKNPKISNDTWFTYQAIKRLDPELTSMTPLLNHDNDSVREVTAHYLKEDKGKGG